MPAITLSASFLRTPDVAPADEHVLVGVKITPGAAGTRHPFHLALLLDSSGSMEGARMIALKRTLHLLIDALENNDRLSIIQYESEAHSLCRARVMTADAREELHTQIDDLVADGGTNLEDALVVLREVNNDAGVDSVFLLTDGHINVGLTSGAGLHRLLSASVTVGTPVNTLGYGSDHNSRLLRDMALRTCGTYTFADADELLPAIIGDITGGLAAEVGRGATVTIPEGWTCLEVGALVNDTKYSVGTLIADKPQWVVLRGPVAGELATMEPIQCNYTVNGVSYTESVIPREADTHAVALQRDRVRVAVVFTQVTTQMETGLYQDARTALTALGAELEASEAASDTFAIRLRAQVDEMLATLQTYIDAPALHRGWGNALAPMVSRLASNTTALGNQRGFFTTGRPLDDPSAFHDNATFSSPLQRTTTGAMTQRYVSVTHDPVSSETTEYDEL